MSDPEIDNYKLRDKQNTLEIDNSVENIQRDDMCTGNLVKLTSNMHELQDNKSDLMGK